MKEPNLLFIMGNAQAGKDTLFKCISHLLRDVVECKRFALADELKFAVNNFTRDTFKISAFTSDIEEKTLIRPILVETAEILRKISKGTYFTNILQPQIEWSIGEGRLPIITDGRFDEYPEDEVWWAKTKNNGASIFVERTLPDGTLVQPANSKEAENEQKLKNAADFCVNWSTSDDFSYLCNKTASELKELLNIICLKYKKPPILT